MTPGQRERLAFVRTHLRLLADDVQASRDKATDGDKGAFRYPLRRLEHADAQLKFAEQDDDRRRKVADRGR